MVFQLRLPDAPVYPKSAWTYRIVGGDHEWLGADKGSRYLDARSIFFYPATVNTPAMVRKMIGLGSQCIYAARDMQGNCLDGAKNYKLNTPAVDDQLVAPTVLARARTARGTSTLLPKHPQARQPTGLRPCRARAGSFFSASMARWSRALTRPGVRARSNW
jgi:hypothetical protein